MDAGSTVNLENVEDAICSTMDGLGVESSELHEGLQPGCCGLEFGCNLAAGAAPR